MRVEQLKRYQFREDLLPVGGYKSEVGAPANEDALIVLELFCPAPIWAKSAKIVADSRYEICIFYGVFQIIC